MKKTTTIPLSLVISLTLTYACIQSSHIIKTTTESVNYAYDSMDNYDKFMDKQNQIGESFSDLSDTLSNIDNMSIKRMIGKGLLNARTVTKYRTSILKVIKTVQVVSNIVDNFSSHTCSSSESK